MHNLTPSSVELLAYREDSADTRYFQLRILPPQLLAVPQPGQFFMLSVPGCGEAPFTYATLPNEDGEFHTLIRKSGILTKALFDLKPGQRLGIRGPFGRGWPLTELAGRRVLIIAGGCGLAPLNGLIDHLVESKQCTQLALIYGARAENQQVLNCQRKRWRTQIEVVDVVEETSGGETPLSITPKLLSNWSAPPDRVLLCGPELMMRATADFFLAQGYSAACIWASVERRMHCAVGLCGHCYIEHQYACVDGPTYRWDQLRPLLRQ